MNSPQERPTIVRHKVNALLLLLAAVTYMDRVCIAQMAAPIRADLGLDDRGIGVLNTLLFEHTRRRGAVLLTSHQALTLADPAPRELRLEAPAAAQGDGR